MELQWLTQHDSAKFVQMGAPLAYSQLSEPKVVIGIKRKSKECIGMALVYTYKVAERSTT